MDALVTEVWDELYDRVRDDLRAVAWFTPKTYTGELRPDIEERYDVDEQDRVIDDTIIRQLGLSDRESDLKAGDLRAFVRVFENAWVVSWREPSNIKSGFFVSIERDGDEATMADVEYCIRYLDEEIEPRL